VRFGGLAALSDVGFGVVEGTAHGLIGPNGAGKTTLFNVISGFARPQAGRIRFAGQDILDLPAEGRASLGIARTFQNIRLFADMSVLETVMTGMHLRMRASLAAILLRLPGFRAEERRAQAEALALLDLVGLAGAGRRAGDLSYGEQRRLEIARALAAGPKLLMLDEPAAGMNPSEKAALVGLVARLQAEGLTILLVEHDMPFVMALCDRITVLNFGRRIAEGSPVEIRADRQVIAAYLGGAPGPNGGQA
jgi:branched-chain amino acid transport system ATP-binding protein